MEQLKRFYENKRMLARKKVADVRQEVLKAGGGPPPPKNDEDELVLSTMDPLIFEGHKNQFDSDIVTTIDGNLCNQIEYIFEPSEDKTPRETPQQSTIQNSGQNLIEKSSENDFLEESEEIMISYDTSMDNNDIIENEEKTNWKKYNINDLKRPISTVLKRLETNNAAKESEDQQPLEKPITTHENSEKTPKIARGGNRRGRGACSRRIVQDRRRPTATVVRSLASNALAQKYNELADKKNITAEHAIKKIERERLYAEEEHQFKMENMELDLQIKKKQLEKLSRI